MSPRVFEGGCLSQCHLWRPVFCPLDKEMAAVEQYYTYDIVHDEHRIKGSHLNYYERFIENNTAHGRTALIMPHNPKERYTQKTTFMDAIKVAKVEGVLCSKAGSIASGTVHLTAHHLIFHYDDPAKEEMWIPYPLISLVTRLPLTLQGSCPLTIRTRTFEAASLLFGSEREAIDVFDSVKELTVATSVTQLYAFYYVPNPPYTANN
ncbi:predicted protein, partial [Postia placenta Mad-698-R]